MNDFSKPSLPPQASPELTPSAAPDLPPQQFFETEIMDFSNYTKGKFPTFSQLKTNEFIDDSHTLTPSFYLCKGNQVTQYEIPASKQIFKIGRSESCDIALEEPMISAEQVAIVKLGDMCYFMDCGTHDCVSFNGVKERQAFIPAEGRMVMKVGNTWLVYIGIDSHDYADMGDSMLVKKSLGIDLNSDEKPHGELFLKSEYGEWLTHSSAVLIGSHVSCDYKIFGKDVKPFHALIYFSPYGVFVEDLTHGYPGIVANGLKTIGATKVEEDDFVIEIDKTPIHLKSYGDLNVRCDFLFEGLEREPGLAISQLNSVEPIMFELPTTHETIMIGSSDECHIQIEDESVSPVHADLFVSEKCLRMKHRAEDNVSFINLKRAQKASIHPGDIFELGDAYFLLHYQ